MVVWEREGEDRQFGEEASGRNEARKRSRKVVEEERRREPGEGKNQD
jgi:hypothetical protein